MWEDLQVQRVGKDVSLEELGWEEDDNESADADRLMIARDRFDHMLDKYAE